METLLPNKNIYGNGVPTPLHPWGSVEGSRFCLGLKYTIAHWQAITVNTGLMLHTARNVCEYSWVHGKPFSHIYGSYEYSYTEGMIHQ